MIPFEDQEFLEMDRDGKVFNASGIKPQEPVKAKTAS
jgi:hypothetical protein